MKRVLLSPARFYAEDFDGQTDREARWFAALNGFVLVLVFFLLEIVTGGRISWPLLLAAALAAFLGPLVFVALSALWAFFVVLAARLLGETLDPVRTRKVTDFSTAGLLPLALGSGWLSLLSLWTVVLQVWGLERVREGSRFKAALLAGFPFLLLLTLLFMVAVIFKTRVF